MSDTNEHEERNRAAKAYKLVRLFEAVEWNADKVASLSADDWCTASQLAKVTTPSDRTKAIVLHILRERSDG